MQAAEAATFPKHETLSQQGNALWTSCLALRGVASDYLMARNCVIPPVDGHLRWHPRLRHPSGYVGPGLVGLVTGVASGTSISLHRTWILPDGRKAAVNPPRLLLSGHRKAGGCIRLWPDGAIVRSLGIGEGIESCLSLAHAVSPVWSCIDANNLSAFPILPSIEVLTIAADHDEAGKIAAHRCLRRWIEDGRNAFVVMPHEPNTDLNDVVRSP